MEYKYVREALSYYNIPESEVTLLRHNENMTFHIGTDYLLQIHGHVEGVEDRMKRWCKESFEPFCAGERLFADDFYLIQAGNYREISQFCF